MHEHYARQDPDFVPYEAQRKEAKTFEAQGLSQKEIVDYLATENGQLYLDKLQAAAPDKSFDEIINRAIGQIKSGSTIPKLVVTDSPLVKIVPVGKEVSDYSPFFTTMDELRRASQSKATLADLFGLPLTSEASKYSVFEITPIKPTEVFVSKVAPTIEFGGSVARSGDVFQSIVTNRGEWSAPRLIGTLDN